MRADHGDYIELLRKLRSLPKVKKVFIRSGIRFDYVLADSKGKFLKELCEHHVSGQLKVAPEHVADKVLKRMGKPTNQVYQKFVDAYEQMNRKLGKKQYLVWQSICGTLDICRSRCRISIRRRRRYLPVCIILATIVEQWRRYMCL